MKRLIKHIVICSSAVLGLSACYHVGNICADGLEPIDLTVKTDWYFREEGHEADAGTHLSIYGVETIEHGAEYSDETYTVSLVPNVYQLLLLNTNRQNVQLDHADWFETAEVSVIETTSVRNGEVEALMPSTLYCAKLTELTLQHSQTVTMDLKPYYKEIIMNLTMDGEVDILSAGGYFTGAARSLRLSTAQASAATVRHAYTLDRQSGNFWTGTISILGLSSDEAVRNSFTISVQPDGYDPIALSEDITQRLRAAFADNWQVTLNINISVGRTPAGFTMTLVSWSTSATGGGTIQ